ncbi:hypothetical protein RND81_07G168500 [Saponaria officinalis]|uniref:AT3G52170-like helix-turn-helix domain-containing protein n=1 Tax=Saponaria officinalis TaxID=3572 RepID=A0AAW1JT49_SAPOF
MYAIKGSWFGQTFALATSSDSAGRKSRIRRSKEERKSMVVTFIRRYQSSNNGNFPSLNLTHKEVGGSFYTVREIVREIIQENRVLGPARFSPELLRDENGATEYPLGSLATDIRVSSSSDVLLNSSGQCFDEIETSIDDVTDVNQINGLSDETDELQAAGSLVAEEELGLNGAYDAQVRLPTEEVVVETFPLRPENEGTDDLGRLSNDSENSNGTWNDFEMKPVDSTSDRPHVDAISSSVGSVNHVATEGTSGSQLSRLLVSDRCPNIDSSHLQLNGEIVQHDERCPMNEASDISETPEIYEGTSVLHENMDRISSHSAVTSKTAEQPNRQNASKGMTHTEDRSSNSNDKEHPSEAVSDKINQRNEKAAATSPPPVDRINLRSWERAAVKRQPNLLLAIVKAFADALIKFWS